MSGRPTTTNWNWTKKSTRVLTACLLLVVSLTVIPTIPSFFQNGGSSTLSSTVHVKEGGEKQQKQQPPQNDEARMMGNNWMKEHFPHCMWVYDDDSPLDHDRVVRRTDVGDENEKRNVRNQSKSDEGNKKDDYRKGMQYVKSDHLPRYDHSSCFVMKSRYNCAHLIQVGSNDDGSEKNVVTAGNGTRRTGEGKRKGPPPPGEATDFKLVWYPPLPNQSDCSSGTNCRNFERPCDFRAIIDTVGGPAGIAREIVPRWDTTREFSQRHPKQQSAPPPDINDGHDEARNDRPVYQVLLMGNSYVRQVFEALVCGFRHDITDLKLQVGGPDSTKAGLRLHGIVNATDMGDMVEGLDVIKDGGCHGTSNNTQKTFFPKDITAPPTIDSCNDDIGMVEFNRSIRFYYIFRPFMFSQDSAYPQIRQRLGFQGDTVDVFAFSDKSDRKPYLTYLNITKARRTIDLSQLLPSLKDLQRGDLGYFFGANNPWITHVPDAHPCMPGVPDDEVNLFLYLLLVGGSKIGKFL